MQERRMLLGMAAIFSGLAGADEARAQDASFGCKVLLCAAATAPSWSGIPYCVPVMQELFRELARGQAWPSCQEGQAGTPQHDPVQFWLPPTQPADRQAVADHVSAEGAACYSYAATQKGGYGLSPAELTSGVAGGSGQNAATVRATRTDCDVDVLTPNATSRFWFSLNGR